MRASVPTLGRSGLEEEPTLEAVRGRPRLRAGFALRTRLAAAALLLLLLALCKCPLFIVGTCKAASKPGVSEEFRS